MRGDHIQIDALHRYVIIFTVNIHLWLNINLTLILLLSALFSHQGVAVDGI